MEMTEAIIIMMRVEMIALWTCTVWWAIAVSDFLWWKP